MNALRAPASHLALAFIVLLIGGCLSNSNAQPSKAGSSKVSIGGEPVVVLQRSPAADQKWPQFLEATVLPGRGMAVLQIKAYLPGKGEIDLLNSPPQPEAGQLLDKGDDEFGNQG